MNYAHWHAQENHNKGRDNNNDLQSESIGIRLTPTSTTTLLEQYYLNMGQSIIALASISETGSHIINQ